MYLTFVVDKVGKLCDMFLISIIALFTNGVNNALSMRFCKIYFGDTEKRQGRGELTGMKIEKLAILSKRALTETNKKKKDNKLSNYSQ